MQSKLREKIETVASISVIVAALIFVGFAVETYLGRQPSLAMPTVGSHIVSRD